jgi:diguanylate cyclase (GGDEF)-like protein
VTRPARHCTTWRIFTDITVIKEHAIQRLERIAHYDALTNLPNRVLLADRLQHAIDQCQRRGLALTVLYLDLDGFKSVNDQHGHAVGDSLLVEVSKQMKATLRAGDTLARIGGDEFVAVLVDLERPEAFIPVIERMMRACAEPVTINGAELRVTASIGVAIYPQDGVRR